ncbi:hypothetical protein DGWBC_0562 [Dehalogenimonas sp. WBC-2]|nr:hypothetical protein DGWBC_0562 [Dehalogenimonas sp. WBC-2]
MGKIKRILNRSVMICVIAIVAIVLPFGCSSGDESTTPTTGNGEVYFTISDASTDLQSVTKYEVTIDKVEAHVEGGSWTVISTESKTYDLIQLKNQNQIMLVASSSIKAANYDRVRCNVAKATITDNTGVHQATLVKNTCEFDSRFEIKSDTKASVNLDFLADKCLYLTTDGKYVMATSIRCETRNSAQIQVSSNNEVQISGGQTQTNAHYGMGMDGMMKSGFELAADAALKIEGSAVVVITGQAMFYGTVSSVNIGSQTLTCARAGGSAMTLNFASSTQLLINGTLSLLGLVDVSGQTGKPCWVVYDTTTNTCIKAFIGTGFTAS